MPWTQSLRVYFYRLRWLQSPVVAVLAVLQRTPVVRIAAYLGDALGGAGPGSAGTALVRSASVFAALGAIDTVAGASVYIVANPTSLTAKVGTPISGVAFGLNGNSLQASSWRLKSNMPPGLTFSNPAKTAVLTGPGLINSTNAIITGTPTDSSGSPYVLDILAYESPNGQDASTEAGYTITVTGSASVPVTITSQPVTETVVANGTAVFSVVAASAATLSYQWSLNGAAISNATSARLMLNNNAPIGQNTVSVTATNSSGGSASLSDTLIVVAANSSSGTNPGRLTNLSVLTSDITATQALTLGFVVGSGSPALPLLLRGSGPALKAFSITNYIPDPTVALYNSAPTLLASNQGWCSTSANQTAVTAAETTTSAFPFAVNSADSALVQSLSPGGFSIIVQSATSQSGSTLGEVFDASTSFTPSNSHLINLSSRLAVGTGHALTAGFTISGSTSKTVLVRGVGPTLGSFGLTGLMTDPQLTLFGTGSVQLATNTGWGGDPQIAAAAAAVSAFTLPSSSTDSALLLTLPPGGYTAQVISASGAGGNALVEVYEVP